MLGWYVWPFREGFSQLPSSPFRVRAVHLLQLSFVACVEGLAPKVHWNKMPSLIAAEVEGLAWLSSPIFRFTFHLLHLFVVAGWKGRLFRGGWARSSQPSFWHLHSYALSCLCLRRPVMCFPLLGLLQFLQQWLLQCLVPVCCLWSGGAFYRLPILPFSSLFHVLFQLLLLRRVGWLFSGSWAMFSQRLPWHLHRFYFSCLCLLAARVCQGEKRPNMFPSFAFLWLSPVLGWKDWLFRKGWAGVEGPPHQAEGGTCPLEKNLLSFGPLLLLLQRRRGSRFRESWAAYLLWLASSHFTLHVLQDLVCVCCFWRGRVFSQFPFFPFICQFRALCQLLLLHWVGWFFNRGWARFSQLLPCHGHSYHSSSCGCLCLLVGCFCLLWQPPHSSWCIASK